jgi:hypothetical protein
VCAGSFLAEFDSLWGLKRKAFSLIDSIRLAAGVHFCLSQGHGIFLDLKHDMYSAIPVPGSARAAGAAEAFGALEDALLCHRDMLLSEGLVTEGDESGRALDASFMIERPHINIFHPDDARAFGLGGEQGDAVSISGADLKDAFAASWQASRQLRLRHIFDVVEAVRTRKAGRTPGVVEDYRREVAIFRRLRPWYPRSYLCLWDALALIEFLARRALFPEWIFGVQAQPFGAHCWLQVNGMLLNENTEYAGQFTPIMRV